MRVRPPSWQQQLTNLLQNIRVLLTYDLYDTIQKVDGLPRIEQKIANLSSETVSIKNKLDLLEEKLQAVATELTSVKNRIETMEQVVQELAKQTRMPKNPSDVAKEKQPHTPVDRLLPELGRRDVLDTKREYSHPIDIQHCDMLLGLHQPIVFCYDTPVDTHGDQIYSSYHIRYWNTPQSGKQTCEDTLLYDIFQDELFCVVADGVSQSAYSNIAARYVCALLHFEWMTASRNNEFTVPQLLEKTQQLVREALYQATYLTNTAVSNQIPGISDEVIKDTTERIFANAGSQATFACVFTFQSHIVCAWMGNTRIVCTDVSDTPTPLIEITDRKFDDDYNRFSSKVYTVDTSIGMRGQLFVKIIPCHHMSKWQMMIFSDALEAYKGDLLQQTLSTSLTSDTEYLRALLGKSVEADDTSLITIIFDKTKQQ